MGIRMYSQFLLSFSVLVISSLSGCVTFPLGYEYSGPIKRPQSLEEYYSVKKSYTDFSVEVINEHEKYNQIRITLNSGKGESVVDYFKGKQESDSLIFVLPISGGKNGLSEYFARYYVMHGFDAAIVHRNSDFKNPEHFHKIEEVFKDNVIRDRIVIDFFENEYNKRNFGSFGISRGAINAAMTAGVDKRLKYNVIGMGGADLSGLLLQSEQGSIKKYVSKVVKANGFTEKDLKKVLREQVKTDPLYLAKYMDARNTLMILAMFDRSVPLKYGLKLRKKMGYPETIFLFSGHYTSVAFTQYIKLIPRNGPVCLIPLDYIETETLAFFRKSFDSDSFSGVKHALYKVVQFPFYAVIRAADVLF